MSPDTEFRQSLFKGSATSGNWGHAGRPGMVGGSGIGAGPAQWSQFTKEQQQKIIDAKAAKGITFEGLDKHMQEVLDRAKASGILDKERDWYRTENKVSEELGNKYKGPDGKPLGTERAAAIIASLSPQQAYPRDKVLSEMVMKLTDHNPDMLITDEKAEAINHPRDKNGNPVKNIPDADPPVKAGIFKFNDLTAQQAARAFPFSTLTTPVEHAIALARGANIDDELKQPKVRSFETNMAHPEIDHVATIDAHQMAAMLQEQLPSFGQGKSGEYSELGKAFIGSELRAMVDKKPIGYAFYSEAVSRIAAAQRPPMLAHEAQAVIWTQWNSEHSVPDDPKAIALLRNSQTKLDSIP